jgi:hydroxyacylglutathione hydrolase
MFHRIFDEGLAHSSYVIACDRTREAAVVDPRRDVDVYVSFARQYGLTLRLAIETHVHADFVSGARELSLQGALVVSGPGAGLRFEHQEFHEDETRQLGNVALRALHTPGHTPEHISILVDIPGEPVRAFTGDTLFVGAVGRPDLLGDSRARELAEDLYVSIFQRLLALPDDVQVHPAHGAGSLCGTGIGRELHSTIGQERHFNPMLQHRSKEAFVDAVLRDLPATPPYFVELKHRNQQGPALLRLADTFPLPPALSPRDADRALRRGAIAIDLRAGESFAAGHPAGAINIGFGSKVGYWAGWVIPVSTPIVLVTDDDARQVEEARRQLLRVGVDDVLGYVDGGFLAWRAAGLPVEQLTQVTARDLHQRSSGAVTLVDVRSAPEFEAGHIGGALHVPIETIGARVREIPRALPVATICEGGYRSMLAASLLARAGIRPVGNVSGGMSAYRPLETTV